MRIVAAILSILSISLTAFADEQDLKVVATKYGFEQNTARQVLCPKDVAESILGIMGNQRSRSIEQIAPGPNGAIDIRYTIETPEFLQGATLRIYPWNNCEYAVAKN